ncbi:hypothetical protein P171DRAFT_433028 [Karstenula rhodostoma CBS 690.94]|uniref:BTB domain-containing protein n=1 Tax=Karstenula rhodostoma CBS 690.94 TaxID=1392251 RepID=A0A9P4PH80_9PLEO|nr:hypothetical protein P171DRAFT_433028 [Karstenula rhodostoma CBS 690.94]
MTAPQDKPLNELLSRSMVDIYVGPENTHWILHEKLLCHHSPFFRSIFYAKGSTTTSFGLPDEEDAPFKTLVGWLYSSSLPVPREESDLTMLLDLYLMAEKFRIPGLIADVLQVVREWYKFSDSYPGLRRVQYVYANTEDGSPMRHMLVHSVARMVVLEQGIPSHWDKALKKNGQLAVDILKAIQNWRLDEASIPDARDDPADAEELIDVEAEMVDAEEGDAEGAVEADADEGDAEEVNGQDDDAEAEAGEDSTDDTVVDSPVQAQHPAGKKLGGAGGKASDMAKNFKEMSLGVVPNGLTNNDYGTLAH